MRPGFRPERFLPMRRPFNYGFGFGYGVPFFTGVLVGSALTPRYNYYPYYY